MAARQGCSHDPRWRAGLIPHGRRDQPLLRQCYQLRPDVARRLLYTSYRIALTVGADTLNRPPSWTGEGVMKARRLIESADFPPETLSVMYLAFDEAWAEVSHHFGEDRHATERTRLAHAILAIAREDSSDVAKLKADALQVYALSYRV